MPRVNPCVAVMTLTLASIGAALPASRPTAGLHYRLEGDPDRWDPDARRRIVKAMDEATAVYAAMKVRIDLTIPVDYSPQTPTADANYKVHVRFGGQIGTRTALHEIAHILGVGTAPGWGARVKDGKWTGPVAGRMVRSLDGPAAVLHADRQHFWPYGLNYDAEGQTPEQLRRNVLMVLAIRADLVIGPTPVVPTTRPNRLK